MNLRNSPQSHPEQLDLRAPYQIFDTNHQEIKEHDIVQFVTNYNGLLGAHGRVEYIDRIIIGIEVRREDTNIRTSSHIPSPAPAVELTSSSKSRSA
jgi:hypothetical protein